MSATQNARSSIELQRKNFFSVPKLLVLYDRKNLSRNHTTEHYYVLERKLSWSGYCNNLKISAQISHYWEQLIRILMKSN